MTRYYVMQRSSAHVGGYHTVAIRGTRADAARMARAERGRTVWTEQEHNRWHREAIMPRYREVQS